MITPPHFNRLSCNLFLIPLIVAFLSTSSFAQNTQEFLFGGSQKIVYNLDNGEASYFNKNAVITNFHAEVKTTVTVSSKDYSQRTVEISEDTFTVVNTGPGMPTMRQWFVKDDDTQISLGVSITANEMLYSNYMAPIVAEGVGVVDVGVANGNFRTLKMPSFQPNGKRWEYPRINASNMSFNVTILMESNSRKGFVIGALSHKIWRSAIFSNGSGNKLDTLKVVAGVPSELDVRPHGKVKGQKVTSATFRLGYYNNFKVGLEKYAAGVAEIAPKLGKDPSLNFDENTIVSWKTWGNGAAKDDLTYEELLEIPDILRDSLQAEGWENNAGKVVVHIAGKTPGQFDNMKAFREKVIANGHILGAYFGPFGLCTDCDENDFYNKNTSDYTIGDVTLRDENGDPVIVYTKNGSPHRTLDVTHPGAVARILKFLNTVQVQGNQYLRLDFMQYGPVEGIYHNPDITTGIQAYNFIMQEMMNKLENKVHINLAISPYFPHGYGHSRRISGDTRYAFETIEYELNALAGGWWLGNGVLHNNLDPGDVDFNPTVEEPEVAMSQMNAAAITGFCQTTDDLNDPWRLSITKKYFTNPDLMKILNLGASFEPLDISSANTPNVFFHKQAGTDTFYVAVFNHTEEPTQIDFDISRIANSGAASFKLFDVWSKEELSFPTSGDWSFNIPAQGSKLYVVTPSDNVVIDQTIPEGYGWIKAVSTGNYWHFDEDKIQMNATSSSAFHGSLVKFTKTPNKNEIHIVACNGENIRYFTTDSSRPLKANGGTGLAASYYYTGLTDNQFYLNPSALLDNRVRLDNVFGDIDPLGDEGDNTIFEWVPATVPLNIPIFLRSKADGKYLKEMTNSVFATENDTLGASVFYLRPLDNEIIQIETSDRRVGYGWARPDDRVGLSNATGGSTYFYGKNLTKNELNFERKLNSDQFLRVDDSDDMALDINGNGVDFSSIFIWELANSDGSIITTLNNTPMTHLTVHPNPITDHISIGFNDGNAQSIHATLLGVNGATIGSWDVENGVNHSVADLPPGLYILKLQEGTNQSIVKLVK